MPKRTGLLVVAVLAMLAWVGEAGATLSVFNTFTGNELVSTDGCGSTTASCTLQSNIQAGSTIQAAYLYSSTFSGVLPPVLPDPNGITLSKSGANITPTFIPLGENTPFLQAWRADVTSFVQANANIGSLTTWTVTEGGKTSGLDGEAIVIVYSNAGAQPNTHTILILDGFSASKADTANITFTPLPVGFTAHMFLGDGHSFDGVNPLAPGPFIPPDLPIQVSAITVNGTNITTVAGHCDDAQDITCDNGNLLTMGGSNAGSKNDPFTPFPCGDPCIGFDHEAYDLGNVFKVGDTSGTLNTFNKPTPDDNIFLEVFDISGIAAINAPLPPTGPAPAPVPEPGTFFLLGAGLMGLAGLRRVLKRRT